MKIMRIIRNMNAISFFLRNCGASKSFIAFANRAVGIMIAMAILALIISFLAGA